MILGLVRRWLSLFMPPEHAEAVLGDLEEETLEKRRSSFWFWRQVLSVSFAHVRELRSERERSTPRRRGQTAEYLHSWLGDFRHGARSLYASPCFTATAAVTLALGIGGVTALFSIVNGVLLGPLPYPRPDRIARVWNAQADDPLDGYPLSLNEVAEYGARNQVFDAFSGLDYSHVNLAGADEPRRVLAARVEASYFDVFAVSPVGLLATLVPTRRALRVDPAATLRSE